MVQDQQKTQHTIDRRRILRGLGIAGTAGIAGCFEGDGDGNGGGNGNGGNGTGNGTGNGNGNGGNGGGEDQITFPLEVQLEVNASNDDRVQMVELVAEAMDQTGYFSTSVETYEWNTYVGRILDPEYNQRGHIGCVGLSGSFSPDSFCDALHHSKNIGGCCNMAGVDIPELDQLIESARFGADVAEDPQVRAERYDEIWRELTDLTAYGFTHFDLSTSVTNTDVIGMSMWPFHGNYLDYALYGPADEQVIWLDRDGEQDPENADLSELKEGGTLRPGISANVDSFDPPYSNDTTSSLAQSFIYEGLTTNDSKGNIYPWLAESYELVEQNDIERTDYEDYMRTVEAGEEGVLPVDEQIVVRHPEDAGAEEGDEVRVLTISDAADAVEDGTFGMQYRYHLEEGVEFHNGEEMTAETVVKSYERYENSDLANQTYDSTLYYQEVDEYTVDIFAQVIDADAERDLPIVTIVPMEHTELEGGQLDPRQGNDPIGTGPYVFEEFEDAQYYRVTKNENYWVEQKGIDTKDWFDGPSEFPDGPVIDEIDIDIVEDDATRSGALQNDEIDITTGLTTDTLDDYDASEDFVVSGVETGGYEFFAIPLNIEPFDDDRLRKAINHLIPRQQIVENVLSGWAREAWTPVPQVAQGVGTTDPEALEEDLKPANEFDPQRAAELIDEVISDHGYPSDV